MSYVNTVDQMFSMRSSGDVEGFFSYNAVVVTPAPWCHVLRSRFTVLCVPLLRLLWSLVVPCAYLSLVLTLVLLLLLLGVRMWLQGQRKARRAQDGGPAVAFFHPYCNAGGGGERVLWCSLRALMHRYRVHLSVCHTV